MYTDLDKHELREPCVHRSGVRRKEARRFEPPEDEDNYDDGSYLRKYRGSYDDKRRFEQIRNSVKVQARDRSVLGCDKFSLSHKL